MALSFRVYCAATPEYRAEAEALRLALAPHGIVPIIVSYESRRSWEANTLRRPVEVLRVYEGDLDSRTIGTEDSCWLVDADIAIRSNPGEFFRYFIATSDVALAYRHDKASAAPDFRISAGIVGWRGDAGLAFLSAWAGWCEYYEVAHKKYGLTYSAPEQWALGRAEEAARENRSRIQEIPAKYHCLPQDVDLLEEPAVICHTPASRTKKRIIGVVK